FLRPGKNNFHEAWQMIEHYIKGEKLLGHPLYIKVLLIDPTCQGAYHRSRAEETQVGGAGRLGNNVFESLRALCEFERQQEKRKSIHLEVKLYRTPPILYLVQTDFVSYVQQYHFWPQYNPDLNIPVIRYQGRSSSDTQGRSMHDELSFHFDYLWKHCSVNIPEFLEEAARGYDTAVREASIENICYDDPALCKKRILHLMDGAKERLYLKGITLRTFFSDGELFDKFCEVAVKDGIEVRVLLADPECEQAKIRSFREYLLKNK